MIDEPHDAPHDPGGEVVDAEPEHWERPIDKFRRSGAGTVIAAGLLGVRDALEGRPEREEPAIVSGAPESPQAQAFLEVARNVAGAVSTQVLKAPRLPVIGAQPRA